MGPDLTPLLEALTVEKLRDLAQRHSIDVSKCRRKHDYVELIRASKAVSWADVRSLAPQPAAEKRAAEVPAPAPPPPAPAPAPAPAEVERDRSKEIEESLEKLGRSLGAGTPFAVAERPIREELENIITDIGKGAELPKETAAEVDHHLNVALQARATFFGIDAAAEAAWGKYTLGQYYQSLVSNREAREKAEDAYTRLEAASAALAIRASEGLLTQVIQAGGRVDGRTQTALIAAKQAFHEGPAKRRTEAVASLERLAMASFDALMDQTGGNLGELQQYVASVEAYGAPVHDARHFLGLAEQARAAGNLQDFGRFASEARRLAERASELRITEIKYTIPRVKAAVEEAKSLGARVVEQEREFEAADHAVEEGRWTEAVQLLSKIEAAADEGHRKQIQSAAQLEERQLQKAGLSLHRLDPLIGEARGYGLDVAELLHYANHARIALQRRDYVSASKFVRRAEELVQALEPRIEEERKRRTTAVHQRDIICGKCGQRTMHVYPDGTHRCANCGHSFAIPAGSA